MTEAELIRNASLGKAAYSKMEQAAALRKQAEQVLEFVKGNPKEALARLGVDLRKFSEDTLMEIIKRDQETPEQKKAREMEDKIRTYEAKEKAAEENTKREAAEAASKKEREARQEKEAAIAKKYDDMFVSALDTAGVPKTAWSVARMATLMRVNLRQGFELGAEQLAKIVKEDYEADHAARLPKTAEGKFDGDKLLELLGKDAVDALWAAQYKKLKGAKPKFSTPVNKPETPASTEGRTPTSWRQFVKENRKSKF